MPQNALLVYPRVCGGSRKPSAAPPSFNGLSPRVRGKQQRLLTSGARQRSIPACAGEAVLLASNQSLTAVYPRVCGGSAPRRFGNAGTAGLSPRVRGKHGAAPAAELQPGSIPACAGEAVSVAGVTGTGKVYPRVCGGSLLAGAILGIPEGLSPRVRGKRLHGRPVHQRNRSIPACAGEAPLWRVSPTPTKVYPRVCGGSTLYAATPPLNKGLSPRVRGKRPGAAGARGKVWSIPACAGEASVSARPTS